MYDNPNFSDFQGEIRESCNLMQLILLKGLKNP